MGSLDLVVGDDGHLEQDSMKHWLSPCRDVPKRISSVPNSPSIDIQEDQEGSKQITPRRASARKKVEQELKFGESPIQDIPDKSEIFPNDKRQPPIKSASKSETKKKKTPADAYFKETKSGLFPNAVISSSSADAGDDVFEDYFSPANHKRPLLPDLPVESNIWIPFELDFVNKKRKPRRSEVSSTYNKKQKMGKSSSGGKLNQQSDESSECLQKQDVKTSLSASNCASVCVETETKKQSPLESTSASKTTGEAGKCSSASTSGQPSSQTEDIPDLEQQKLSGLSHAVESE